MANQCQPNSHYTQKCPYSNLAPSTTTNAKTNPKLAPKPQEKTTEKVNKTATKRHQKATRCHPCRVTAVSRSDGHPVGHRNRKVIKSYLEESCDGTVAAWIGRSLSIRKNGGAGGPWKQNDPGMIDKTGDRGEIHRQVGMACPESSRRGDWDEVKARHDNIEGESGNHHTWISTGFIIQRFTPVLQCRSAAVRLLDHGGSAQSCKQLRTRPPWGGVTIGRACCVLRRLGLRRQSLFSRRCVAADVRRRFGGPRMCSGLPCGTLQLKPV